MLPRSEYYAERYLAYLYTIGGVCSLVVTICMIIIWLYWRIVLNTCAGSFQRHASYYDEYDCGCFLWGTDTQTYFVGSHVGYCYWSAFGLILPLFVSFCYGCYHMYRVCCRPIRPRHAKAEMHQRSTEILQLTVEQDIMEDEISPYFWTPVLAVSGTMFIYCLVHAIMTTHGIFMTCDRYRNKIIKSVHATGQFVSIS